MCSFKSCSISRYLLFFFIFFYFFKFNTFPCFVFTSSDLSHKNCIEHIVFIVDGTNLVLELMYADLSHLNGPLIGFIDIYAVFIYFSI